MNILYKVTLKLLQKNRTRTMVTIIGIILSAAMFTAVTTSISSFQHFLIQSAIYRSGNWYGAVYELSAEETKQLSSDSRVSQSAAMELLGYASLEESANESKPYLCVYGIQKEFTEMMPLHITQGRLPQNSSEILLPEHLKTSGRISWALKDTLDLELFYRMDTVGNPLSNRETLSESTASQSSASGTKADTETLSPGETLRPAETRTYTVVGFYERPSFEAYLAPGYTALTIGENSEAHIYDLYLRTTSIKGASHTLDSLFSQIEDCTWKQNSDLLRLTGSSGENRYNQVLYSLGAILMGIIMFGSISLIYNAFSISVSERTQQLGLLASIGATRRQLTGSVLFEALFLSVIGIPLGILSGLLGIGITFFFIKDMIADILGMPSSQSYTLARLSVILGPARENVSLGLKPSLGALVIAVAISLLTVMISAYIPARRAMKKSAIEAIRQNQDISIRSRRMKTSRLTERLFGFEGTLAAKNYRRSRKKYRATVISLFLSIVLFISASSFCAYLTSSAESVLADNGYDLIYHMDSDTGYDVDTMLSELSDTPGVTASTYAARYFLTCFLKTSDFTAQLREYQKNSALEWDEDYQEYEMTETSLSVIFLADDAYRAYLKELNLSEEDFFNPQAPKAVVLNQLRLFDDNIRKYYSIPALKNPEQTEFTVYLTRMLEGYDYNGTSFNEQGQILYSFYQPELDQEKTLTPEEACLAIPLSVGASAEQAPDFFPTDYHHIRLFYPYSLMDTVFSSLEKDTDYYEVTTPPSSESCTKELYFQCEDHTAVCASMANLLVEKELSTSALIDYAASAESDRAMTMVINVFAFGFITLISLIAAANVFNTISTNLNLRRREFAMLRSIGMTPKSFARMMNFECLLYGFKGLLYGLPVSVFVTWLIYRSVSQGLVLSFFIPWYSIVIAVGSVFLVVFATMLYSMRKIRKENTIDALKNENL